MKKGIFTLLSYALLSLYSFAGNGDQYLYSINLTSVTDDKVEVKLVPPALKPGEVLFRIPKIIPGTYSIYDFGRFISDFKVTPKEGKTCDVTQVDENSWKITNADQISEISYWVEDSWDAADKSNWVFEPGGTNIEDKENFVLNNHGFFGYFEGMTKVPYELRVTRPEKFYGSTGLTFTTSGNTDTYHIQDYNTLVDSPIMYNEPDTTFIKVGNAKVLVSVYNKTKMISSEFVAKNIEQILNAQKEYLGGTLPVDKYAFLIYLPSTFTSFGFGALEHSNSSFYFLPAFGEDYLAGMIRDVAAHEFFHILTPLTIHSEEIGNFDFNNPKMSKHLWLYEGCTEYAAHHVQVQYDITTVDEFLETIQEKMGALDDFNDTVPFTRMSEGCLDTYKDQYLNVYQKGALIGMCLDLELLHLSNGEKNLQWLMRQLSKKYGKDKSFKDDELFDVITALTYPEVGVFLNRYVGGPEPLPLKEKLLYAGVLKTEGGNKEKLDIGLNLKELGFNEETSQLYIMSTDEQTEVGKKMKFSSGDVLKKVNGIVFTPDNMVETLRDVYQNSKPGDKISYEIERTDKNQKVTKKVLKGKIGTRVEFVEGRLEPVENMTGEQLAILKAWLNK